MRKTIPGKAISFPLLKKMLKKVPGSQTLGPFQLFMYLNKMKKTFSFFILAACWVSVCAQDKTLFEKKEFISGHDTLRYRLLYPASYKPGKKYPLVLFLHGSGERGNDNEAQLTWGANLFLDSANRSSFPAIVIFPQCPKDSSWARIVRKQEKDSLGGFSFPADLPPTTPMVLVMDLMKNMVTEGKANAHKIYVGGLSMGGFGTYDILWRMPHFFAAAFPICGGGNPEKVLVYAKNYPIWIFHGAIDPVVPVANAHLMLHALQAGHARVKYSEYPGVGHDSWKNAFAEPGLLPWLFSQKKK
jgi:predicted peptidase